MNKLSTLLFTLVALFAQATVKAQSDADVYKVTPILTENFDHFVNGTYDEPDAIDLATGKDGAIADKYMSSPGWVGSLVYQADGTCCIGYNDESGVSGLLSSNFLDFQGRDDKIVVTLRARNVKPYGTSSWDKNYVCVDVIDAEADQTFTNDYAVTTTDWKEYRFEFPKKRDDSHHYYIQFYGYYAPILIDDIVVSYQDAYVNTPVANDFTGFTANGFTANWQPVEGATGYAVSVFTQDKNKNRTYVLENVPTTQCSLAFNTLNTNENIYYYVVRATDGTHYSPESKAIKVEALLVPQNIAATGKGNNQFNVTWDAVPNAQYYEIYGQARHTATKDETVTILSENFDAITGFDKYTELAPFGDLPKQEVIDTLTVQPGWKGTYPVRINGAYGIDGFAYDNYHAQVYLETPIMNLSNNNGTVNLSIDLMGIDNTTAVVRIGHLEGNKWIVDDRIDVTDLTADWKPYNFTLKNGTAASSIDICCKGPSYMYIDNVKVTQELKAGDVATIPVFDAPVKEGTDTLLTVPTFTGLDPIECKVRAVKEVWDEYHFSCDYIVYSPYSSFADYTPETTGINKPTLSNGARAWIENGILRIVNPAAEAVTVFTTDGRQLFADHSASHDLSITLPAHGLFIVKVGQHTVKVAK